MSDDPQFVSFSKHATRAGIPGGDHRAVFSRLEALNACGYGRTLDDHIEIEMRKVRERRRLNVQEFMARKRFGLIGWMKV